MSSGGGSGGGSSGSIGGSGRGGSGRGGSGRAQCGGCGCSWSLRSRHYDNSFVCVFSIEGSGGTRRLHSGSWSVNSRGGRRVVADGRSIRGGSRVNADDHSGRDNG